MNTDNPENKPQNGTRRKTLKIVLVFFVLLAGVSMIFLFPQNSTPTKESNPRINEKAEEALSFCKAGGYNTDFCILVDMKIHSGKYRMFVYDFNRKEIERKALCAHGCGKDDKTSTGAQPLFSNENGSRLTSLGKYKIGSRSYSQWGIHVHYKMHGLEPTNNNAFKRIIVLHSHTPVPSFETYPVHLPMGWSFGCPVTDNDTMTYLDAKLKNTKKPVLLWIFY
ncbi:MAG: murein L,D-transpeptidase catalytic domain family protein [Candidatus Azobacteroides sp.]|nr:murein L,D-transpeptidase catalytic domain family protein [Candidatus Azobacteroides sp.]